MGTRNTQRDDKKNRLFLLLFKHEFLRGQSKVRFLGGGLKNMWDAWMMPEKTAGDGSNPS
jgi:hypothetical protein